MITVPVLFAALTLSSAGAAEPLDIEAMVKGTSDNGTCFQGTTENAKQETVLYIAEHHPNGAMTVTFKINGRILVAAGRYSMPDDLTMCVDWADPELEDSCYKAITASANKIRLVGDTGTWAEGSFTDGRCPE